jgi:hypothetical protein
MYPALEGRFPQVSNIEFEFDPSLPQMARVKYGMSARNIGQSLLKVHSLWNCLVDGDLERATLH